MIRSKGRQGSSDVVFEADLTLKRLKPRIEPLWGDALGNEKIDASARIEFEERLDEYWPQLFALLLELYGNRYDFFYHLGTDSGHCDSRVDRSSGIAAQSGSSENQQCRLVSIAAHCGWRALRRSVQREPRSTSPVHSLLARVGDYLLAPHAAVRRASRG